MCMLVILQSSVKSECHQSLQMSCTSTQSLQVQAAGLFLTVMVHADLCTVDFIIWGIAVDNLI